MNASHEPPAATETVGSNRRRNLLILAAILVLAGLAWGIYWYQHGRWFQSTEDAYVAGNVVPVNAEVSGTVDAVYVRETDAVAAGQLLVELDPRDSQLAMDAAAAELAGTVRQVRTSFAQAERLRAQIAAREAELRRAREDLRRRLSLAGGGAVSDEEINHARESLDALEAAARAAREELKAALAQTERTTPATHPQVLRAAARVREVALALRRTRIVAPVSGVVARKAVQIGQRVSPASPLLSIVQLHDVWVEANFKEVQLERMRIGQPVSLRADLYGKKVSYSGRVEGISPGTGAAFALLPPQNASGNWIKIVQRVPVRIALDPAEVQANPLRLGLSMHAEVDLHDQSGPVLATAPELPGIVPMPVPEPDPAVEALIERVIAENTEPAATP
ncbi:MAG TPA: HlyD family efflux transporter periplasmic adaptor subunit [Steroidobacteraceae bacterium]|nr:HlyD family efflux transporter periplasmic adaptor subunit [Steroidobacteraceae bacterium]